ncbi:hypothetical protein C8J57DRAFT_1713095 [Mycena rebaudengoi]|nr:hypothetical protein C8J57DRAFT_1713095 [Mycena rebaudengoi]
MSRAEQKERGTALNAYLLDPKYGWLESQVSDTQAIDEYERAAAESFELAPGAVALCLEQVREDPLQGELLSEPQSLALSSPSEDSSFADRTSRESATALLRQNFGRNERGPKDLLKSSLVSSFLRGSRVQNSRRITVQKALLRRIQALEKRQQEFELILSSQMEDIVNALDELRYGMSQTVAAALTQQTNPEPDSDDQIPGSDWILDPEEQSQVLVPRRVRSVRSESPDLDPYIPSVESQIEAAIVRGSCMHVVGKLPCVRGEI